MKKRRNWRFLGVLCLLLLAGCDPRAPSRAPQSTPTLAMTPYVQTPGDPPEMSAPIPGQENGAVIPLKVIEVDGTTLLGVSAEEDAAQWAFYAVTVNDPSMLEQASPGAVLEVSYTLSEETYPARLTGVTQVVLSRREDDLTGLYLSMLADLWNTDRGLNEEISILAFDLSEEGNLSQAEKGALRYLAGQRFGVGLETVEATFDQLCAQGLIDREQLSFADGLFFRIRSEALEDGKFQFDAEKWRGGLGAYFFADCTAEKQAEGWTYTVGAEAVA